jgi:hypothetical protein
MIRLRRSRRGQRSIGLNTGMRIKRGNQPAPYVPASLCAGWSGGRARHACKTRIKRAKGAATNEPNWHPSRRTSGRRTDSSPVSGTVRVPGGTWPQSRRGHHHASLPSCQGRELPVASDLLPYHEISALTSCAGAPHTPSTSFVVVANLRLCKRATASRRDAAIESYATACPSACYSQNRFPRTTGTIFASNTFEPGGAER